MYFKNCADKYITFLLTLLQKITNIPKKNHVNFAFLSYHLSLYIKAVQKNSNTFFSPKKKPLFEDFECPCCNICILFRSYIIYSSFLFVCSLTSNLQNILYYKKLSLKKNTTLPSPPFLKTRKPHQCFIDTNIEKNQRHGINKNYLPKNVLCFSCFL